MLIILNIHTANLVLSFDVKSKKILSKLVLFLVDLMK